jgi:hypothetical protein
VTRVLLWMRSNTSDVKFSKCYMLLDFLISLSGHSPVVQVNVTNVVGSCTPFTSICGLGKAACVAWWHYIALFCTFVGLVLRGTGICFCSVLWMVVVRWFVYLCCSPSLLLPVVTSLLLLPIHPEILISIPYKLLHLPNTRTVMGDHLNLQSFVQYAGHNSISRALRTIHHLWVWMYECPQCAQDSVAVFEWW